MKIDNLDYIDSLRWIAIILVLIIHLSIWLPILGIKIPNYILTFIWFWQYGVLLFFLVSSYTLFRSLDLRKENNMKYFFLRRFFRIAPLYYLIIIFLYFTTSGIPYYLDKNTSWITISNLILHILFLNWFFSNSFNSIIWVEATIFTEVWFYLFLPVIYKYRKKMHYTLFLSLLIALLSLIYIKFMNLSFLSNIAIFKSPLVQMLAFLPWCYIYIYEKNHKINNFFKKYKNLILTFILLSFILLSFIQIPTTYTPIILFVIMIFLFSLFFLLVKNNEMKFFNNKILWFIWKISYSLFLIHFIIIYYLMNNYEKIIAYGFNLIYVIIFVLSLIFSLSILTHYYIELPFMKLWKKIINNLK
jgi:peptidoglycan/LPS O-acetylase OafA/YrhL